MPASECDALKKNCSLNKNLACVSEKFQESGGGIGGQHEAGADEEGVVAGGTELGDFSMGSDPRFADGDAVVGNLLDEFERSFDADVERF